jgi:hypothetical protein
LIRIYTVPRNHAEAVKKELQIFRVGSRIIQENPEKVVVIMLRGYYKKSMAVETIGQIKEGLALSTVKLRRIVKEENEFFEG